MEDLKNSWIDGEQQKVKGRAVVVGMRMAMQEQESQGFIGYSGLNDTRYATFAMIWIWFECVP